MVLCLLVSGCGGIWQRHDRAGVGVPATPVVFDRIIVNNIALLLPLQGALASDSRAIRDGFLASYYTASKHNPALTIKVVDTFAGDVAALYKEAVADGADVVVGPLTKKEVEVIKSLGALPVPTIALNTLDDYASGSAISNLYQFGLLPQDEGVQVATKMLQDQHQRAAIIVPKGVWGNKIADAFKAKYESGGGQVVATLDYSSINLSEQVCVFLAQDPQKLCMPQKHKPKDKKQENTSQTMRRQDIDCIFLVATVSQAQQIVPLLKFYYAGDLPIYATSSIYSGVPNQNVGRDIDGIYFCDMPWVLKSPEHLGAELQAVRDKVLTFGGSLTSARSKFYALGIDAYKLATNLNEMLSAPQIGLSGASGVLYLDSYHHIYRDLIWAQMQDGIVRLQH